MSDLADGADEGAEVIDLTDVTEADEGLGDLRIGCEVSAAEEASGAVVVRFLARSGKFGKSGPVSVCSVTLVLSDRSEVRTRRRRDPVGCIGSPLKFVYNPIGRTIADPAGEVVEVVLRIPGTKKTVRFRNVFVET